MAVTSTNARIGAQIATSRLVTIVGRFGSRIPAALQIAAAVGMVLVFAADEPNTMIAVIFLAMAVFAVIGFEVFVRDLITSYQKTRDAIRIRRTQINHFRERAAIAQPGEVWTFERYVVVDNEPHTSWISGPVRVFEDAKFLGEVLLPGYRRARFFTGLFPRRNSREEYLDPGDRAPILNDPTDRDDAPARFAALRTGTTAYVEHRADDGAYEGLRFVEYGVVGPRFANRSGEQFRRVGSSGVRLADVTAAGADTEPVQQGVG